MTNLSFTVLGARAEPFAAVADPDLPVASHGVDRRADSRSRAALARSRSSRGNRHYSGHKKKRLLELFGEPRRWGETLKTLLWTHASAMLPGFTGSLEIDLPVACTLRFRGHGTNTSTPRRRRDP